MKYLLKFISYALLTLMLACVSGIFFSFTSCRSSSPDSITIGAPRLEQNALLYVAEARQFFAKNGLTVTVREYETGVASMNALVEGEVDIAELAEFPFISPVLDGRPVRIIAIHDRFENDYLLALKERGINSPADLRGKTIGLIRGTVLEFYLGRFLELHGINLEEVNIRDTVDPSGTLDALINHELDAVVAFQPHVDNLQAQFGEALLAWPVQSNQLVYGILAAKTDWLSANEDPVQRFLRALVEAEDYLISHPEEAKKIVGENLGYNLDYVDNIWPYHHFSISLDFSLVIALNDETRWLTDHNLVPDRQAPDYLDYIYEDALKAVKPEAVRIIR